MNKKQQAHFKAKLESMSQDILNEAEKTLLEMTDQADNYPDPADRATAESNRNFELRIRDRERKLLAKIKEALERIDNVKAVTRKFPSNASRPGRSPRCVFSVRPHRSSTKKNMPNNKTCPNYVRIPSSAAG
jgi:RNA polymerase-binding protein DksA